MSALLNTVQSGRYILEDDRSVGVPYPWKVVARFSRVLGAQVQDGVTNDQGQIVDQLSLPGGPIIESSTINIQRRVDINGNSVIVLDTPQGPVSALNVIRGNLMQDLSLMSGVQQLPTFNYGGMPGSPPTAYRRGFAAPGANNTITIPSAGIYNVEYRVALGRVILSSSQGAGRIDLVVTLTRPALGMTMEIMRQPTEGVQLTEVGLEESAQLQVGDQLNFLLEIGPDVQSAAVLGLTSEGSPSTTIYISEQ